MPGPCEQCPLRRSHLRVETDDGAVLDGASATYRRGGAAALLTPMEVKVLGYLMLAANEWIGTEELARAVCEPYTAPATIRVRIHSIRAKTGAPIVSRSWHGYMYCTDAELVELLEAS